MSDLNNICVDIETLSTQPNAVIVSIAAVKFSFTSDEVETFEINISPRMSKELGLHVDKTVVNWWQNPERHEAAKAWINSDIEIDQALDEFIDFTGRDKNVLWWAHGCIFDFPIIYSSMIATGMITPPWQYYNVHEMRTIHLVSGLKPKDEPRIGIYHNGLDDCLTQIKNLKKSMNL